ncbi:hypothetical protein SBA2_310012 [Acidobacteriia bacterium SbA2]|nr:hypothetical protein SBA2_310012 [Acidobacteriia bacterium SbA2]
MQRVGQTSITEAEKEVVVEPELSCSFGRRRRRSGVNGGQVLPQSGVALGKVCRRSRY